VSGAEAAGSAVNCETSAYSPCRASFAEPKSSSFTPAFVTTTLVGFRSRWIIPVCRGEAVRDLGGDGHRLVEGKRPLLDARRQRLPLEVLEHEEVHGALGAHVVEGADVRVGERRDRARLALESTSALLVGCHAGRQDLDRYRASEPGVPGPVDFAHAAGPQQTGDLVASEALTGCERGARGSPRWRVERARAVRSVFGHQRLHLAA
jgi:hypothetical protein